MTILKIWTAIGGQVFNEGTLEVESFATRSDMAHLTLKDEGGNVAHITVDPDGLAAIIKVLQDQRDELLPDLDEDLLDIEGDDD